jgi:hypothetical protein
MQEVSGDPAAEKVRNLTFPDRAGAVASAAKNSRSHTGNPVSLQDGGAIRDEATTRYQRGHGRSVTLTSALKSLSCHVE